MKRVWFVLLALSLGLNAGLIYTVIAHHRAPAPRDFEELGAPPDRPGPRGARRGPHRGPDRPAGAGFAQRRLDRMAKWLDLDATQQAAMGAIFEESMPRVLAQRDAVQAARRRAAAQYLKPAVDPDSVRIAVRQLTAAQTALDSLVAETMSREAALLSPEQRARYFTAMPWGERGGPEHEPPPPPPEDDR